MSVQSKTLNRCFDQAASRPHCQGAVSTPPERPRTNRYRRGSMLVETAIGVALAAIAMIAVAQLVAVVANQRREITQRQLATQAVANAMERVMVLPWNELTAEAASRFENRDESAAQLDEPQMSITVSDLEGDALPTKQIEIALSWRDRANRRVEPIRIVAWKHRRAAAE